jgi:hypothetical protein
VLPSSRFDDAATLELSTSAALEVKALQKKPISRAIDATKNCEGRILLRGARAERF